MENPDEADNIACEDEYIEGSIDEDTEREWSAKYLLIGIALPVIPWILMFLVSRWHYFLIRPWLATPLIYAIHASRVITAVVYYLWVRRRFGLYPLFQFGWPRKLLKELALAAFFTLALGLLYWIIETLLLPALGIEIETPEHWVQMGYGRNSVGLILFLIYGFTIVPVAEEIYYRGFVYKVLKFRLPMILALILQATFFAIAHRLDLPNTILIFLLGIVLAIGYELRKNLLTPVLMHCIINARHMIPWIVLMAINLHTPAPNFSAAADPPKWLVLSTFEDIQRQDDGMDQWGYTVSTWAEEGSRHWKRSVKGFEAVFHWFPEDRLACASRDFGVVQIYNGYLLDYRRAIVHARRLLEEYPEQREQCAAALANIGWSYSKLRDSSNSREAYQRVIAEFGEFEYRLSEARQAIQWLDELGLEIACLP